MRSKLRRSAVLTLVTTIALLSGAAVLSAAPAAASTSQFALVEPGGHLLSDPVGTLARLRLIGVDSIRLFMPWSYIAPSPLSRHAPHFNASDPGAYPASHWTVWDTIIRTATADGIAVDLDLGGRAPLWAMPASAPAVAQGSVYPSPSKYQSFVQAVGKRYSGTYKPKHAAAPLPAVTFWSIWNEPDYISSLQPQSTGPNFSVPAAPTIYRNLVDAAWAGLGATGHGHDRIIIGELAPRYSGNQNGLLPLVFLRAMYCVNSSYHPLRGSAAAAIGCPTNASGFRSHNPALFNASGVSDHPYSRWFPPNQERYPGCGQCTSMALIGNLIRAMDKLQGAYGSNRKFPVYSTEYGYMTDPPKHSPDPRSHKLQLYVSQDTAAYYINWAEYISYKNPRIASYDQFLLYDPVKPNFGNDYGEYASGLLTWDGHQKPGYSAYRLPLYLPKTSASSGASLEVWGGARPAGFAALDTGGQPQTVNIQFAPSGSQTFTTVQTVTIANPFGYFDTQVAFPGSGTVRLSYTYPVADMLLAPGVTVYSRHQTITVH